jgi:hypothetical protein
MAYGIVSALVSIILFVVLQPNLLLSVPPQVSSLSMDGLKSIRLNNILMVNKGDNLMNYGLLTLINSVVFTLIVIPIMKMISQ